VRFEHMRLENIPVYLRPLEQDLTLQKDVSAGLATDPLTITSATSTRLNSCKR